jgi:putative transposase
MTNHVHILVTPGTEFSVTHMTQDLGRKYVRYINHNYRRTGILWEGRYKASLVDSEACLITCMLYIEMNPVRAGMGDSPSECRWSSYFHNAQGKSDRLITRHPVYESPGTTVIDKCFSYRALFRNHLEDKKVHDIRAVLNKERVLGRDARPA